jgi:CelD/BcsL family acetyltransferase involved in cellulose biosynthesis
MEPRLNAAVIADTREFAALEEEWEDLYQNSPLATPFQSWAWLYSWWESYGEGYQLRLVTLREEEGLLVGLVPLMVERRWGLGRLLFVGTVQTDYQDMLVREGREREVADAAGRALKELEGWHVADLQQLRPEAAAWHLFRRWDGLRIKTWQEGCPVVEVRPWDELVASLSKNYRSTVRRALRRVETDKLSHRQVGADDVEQAARRLVDLHRELWRGRDITPEHLTRRWGSFVEAAFSRMMARRLAGISEFRRDGEVLISLSWVFGQDFVAFYHSGASRKALQRYQWSSLLIWEGISIAHDRNSPFLDLLRGEEPYKMRWASKVISSDRVILGRNLFNLFIWMPYAILHALRSRAKRYARSDSTPQWVKNTVYRLKRFNESLRNRGSGRL